MGGAIIGGRRLIEGRLLFEEKRNTFFVLFFCLLLHRLAEGSVCRFIFFYMFNCTDPGLQLGDPAPTKTAQKPYPMGPHLLSGLYKGVNTPTPPPPPPPPRAEKAQPASPFFLVFTRLSDSRNVARTRSRENRTLVQVEQATIPWRDCYAQGRVLSTTYRTNPPSYADSETCILPVE